MPFTNSALLYTEGIEKLNTLFTSQRKWKVKFIEESSSNYANCLISFHIKVKRNKNKLCKKCHTRRYKLSWTDIASWNLPYFQPNWKSTCGSKIIFGPIFFWLQTNLSRKEFLSKKYWVKENVWSKKIFWVQQNFGSEKMLCPKKFWAWKNVCSEKISAPKKIRV